MTIASPNTREELKEYILTKLGAPVLEINLADEQLDICINDAFQYFHERQHFNGTEDVYLRMKIEETFSNFFRTAKTTNVETAPNSSEPTVYANGMVAKLRMISSGSNYPITQSPSQTRIIQKTKLFDTIKADKTDKYSLRLGSQGPQDTIGEKLTVNWGKERTIEGGLLSVEVYNAGINYKKGDWIIIEGGNDDAIFEVEEIKNSSGMHEYSVIEQQRNYITLPDEVIGVYEILGVNNNYSAMIGGLPNIGMLNPFLMSGLGGDGNCGQTFDLISYYTLRQWLSEFNFLMRNQIKFSFNQRTHRLHIHGDLSGLSSGSYLVMHSAIKANPQAFPDVFNDRFMKAYAVALSKMAWGGNLMKYSNVQLPGGITLNGEFIYREGKEEKVKLEETFATECADYPLDLVG